MGDTPSRVLCTTPSSPVLCLRALRWSLRAGHHKQRHGYSHKTLSKFWGGHPEEGLLGPRVALLVTEEPPDCLPQRLPPPPESAFPPAAARGPPSPRPLHRLSELFSLITAVPFHVITDMIAFTSFALLLNFYVSYFLKFPLSLLCCISGIKSILSIAPFSFLCYTIFGFTIFLGCSFYGGFNIHLNFLTIYLYQY